jgi:hypothetical protein
VRQHEAIAGKFERGRGIAIAAAIEGGADLMMSRQVLSHPLNISAQRVCSRGFSQVTTGIVAGGPASDST